MPAQPSVDGLPLDPETIHRAALAPLALIGIGMATVADWTSGA